MTKRRTMKKSKKRMRRRRWITGFFAILFALAGIILSLTVFFKITDVVVEGDINIHTQQEILDVAGIEKGTNLFRFNANAKEDEIWETLTYIESVNIRRKLPGTVVIEVTETKKLFAMEHKGQYVVVSNNLKILDISANIPDQVAKVIGISAIDPVKGEALTYEETENITCFFDLVGLLDTYELLQGVTEIDITDKLNYTMIYENRIKIMIGTANNLELKVRKIQAMITEKIEPDEQGFLDVSYSKRIIFKHGDIFEDSYDPEDELQDDDAQQDETEDGGQDNEMVEDDTQPEE